jgi:hypothetical protein
MATNMKIYKIISGLTKLAGDTTKAKGVSYSGQETTVDSTPLTILQDNTDEMVALLQALPAKADIKESISELSDAANKVPRMLQQIASQLQSILQPGSDSKELAKIKATSGLNEFASMLETYSKEFSELNDLASLLSSTSSKHTEKDKSLPVRHTLRYKDDMKIPKPEIKPTEDNSLEDLDKSVV